MDILPNGLAIGASVPVFSVLISSVGQFSLVQNPQNPDPPTCFRVLGSVFVEHHIFPLGSRVHYICSKRLHGRFLEWFVEYQFVFHVNLICKNKQEIDTGTHRATHL